MATILGTFKLGTFPYTDAWKTSAYSIFRTVEDQAAFSVITLGESR
jgi:hypothetical protein